MYIFVCVCGEKEREGVKDSGSGVIWFSRFPYKEGGTPPGGPYGYICVYMYMLKATTAHGTPYNMHVFCIHDYVNPFA